ncbi:patatin-like phospholipase family protein [Candidatus Bipolaricaulota bacterium]|nr:patatin-like phospholipase family protein [Candidatus Bipolaricaulota bacterium]
MDDEQTKTFPKIGLALGSGGARGSAHTGVLKVLEAEGIPISMVAGSSIGSLIGATLAVGIPLEQIEQEWLDTTAARVFRSFLPTLPRSGLSSGNELKKYLKQLLGDARIEDLAMPYAAVACDIDTGEAVILKKGSLVSAVRASTAIPGIFQPVRLGDRLLVDGGLVNPVPIKVCRDLGADFVIAVDITPKPIPTTTKGRHVWNRIGDHLKEELAQPTWIPSSLTELLESAFHEKPELDRPLPGLYSILNQSISILLQEVLRQKLILTPPDILIQPNLAFSMMGYQHAADGIAEGMRATEVVLPQLRAKLAETSAH